jgi:hypothetical protein
MAQTLYDPEHWLETVVRGIKDYVTNNINTRIYDVRMEFPAPALETEKVPLSRTVIHFEVDATPERPLGFGDNVGDWNYDPVLGVKPQYARVEEVNFDVGIWAWDASGGTTSRMKARQELANLFGGTNGMQRLADATNNDDGKIEILSFSGGRFVSDTINDVRVYRMVDCSLDVRVYSRTPIPVETGPTIEQVVQAPNFTIIG